MGILNKLFGSTEALATKIELDDESILKHWQDYHATVPKKTVVVSRLNIGPDLPKDIQELKELLTLELSDIEGEEKEETDLIKSLEAIEHAEKIKRVKKLEQCLCYASTKHEYIYALLEQLHSILQTQMHLVDKLATSKQAQRLISHIQSQFELELEIIKQIGQRSTFHDLFLALVKGEHIIQSMDVREKELLKEMQGEMSEIFSGKITEGTIYEWTGAIFDAIEDKIHEATANGTLDQHADRDFEFVNRREFVDLVRASMPNLGEINDSEQRINVFVHIFREWYNQRD